MQPFTACAKSMMASLDLEALPEAARPTVDTVGMQYRTDGDLRVRTTGRSPVPKVALLLSKMRLF
jgi:hypothetical protein